MRYLLMSLLLLGAASPALQAQTSFVTGQVSVGTHGPAGGMIVEAYNTAGEKKASETTRSDGTYTLSLAAGATYKILAYDPSGAYATSFYRDAGSFETSTEISLVAEQTLRNVSFHLERGYVVNVTVSAPAGAAISDVVVAAYNLNGTRRGFQEVGLTGQTNLVLPAGSYKIVAYDERLNLATEFYSNSHSFETADTVVVDGARSLMIALDYGGTVSGIITDRDGAAPLGGLTVLALDLSGQVIATGTTDLAGRYSFAVPVGTYKIFAFDEEGRYTEGYLGDVETFESAPSVSVSQRQNVSGLSFNLSRAEPVSNDTTLYIPVVASTPGSSGTFFRSDVWIYNPGTDTLLVTLTFLPPPGAGPRVEATVVVPPRGQRLLHDVVATEFHTSGGGSMMLKASQDFVATSRTYNDPPDSEAGTTGLSLPGQPVGRTLSRAVIPGLSNTAAFRSNVGLFNPGDNTIEVTMELFDGSGNLLGLRTEVLEPLEWYQANTIFAALGVQSTVEHAYVILDSDQGSFFSYGSVVDAVSGDATLVLPSAGAAPSEED